MSFLRHPLKWAARPARRVSVSLKLLALGAGLSALCNSAWALSSVTLAWDPSDDGSAVGYRLYEGGLSHSYTNMIDVGSTPSGTVSNLNPGATYYFAVTAYNSAGEESAYSDEISYIVPGAPAAPFPGITGCFKLPSGNMTIRGVGLANRTCVLLAATNLTPPIVWTPVAINSSDAQGDFALNDLQATNYVRRYYRVQFTGPAGASSILALAADSGTLTAPFITFSGAISQFSLTSATNGGRAAYPFNIANAGTYILSAQVNAPSEAANSFYLNIDAEPADPTMIWDIYPLTTGLMSRTVTWRGNGTDGAPQFTPAVFTLSAGIHQLIVRGREANTQLGALNIRPYLAITNCARLLTGNRAISGRGVANQNCVLLAAPSLTAPVVWTPIATNLSDAQGIFTLHDLNATNYTCRFYCIHAQ